MSWAPGHGGAFSWDDDEPSTNAEPTPEPEPLRLNRWKEELERARQRVDSVVRD